jgi:hypothetical protein
MLLVSMAGGEWKIRYEGLLYDAGEYRERPSELKDGRTEFDGFAFGFPTAISLTDGSILTTHWCREDGKFGIRWTKLVVDW